MFRILVLSIIIFVSCQSQETYIYENIKSDIEVYLPPQVFNNFVNSDTLIIYDTSYFNHMIAVLEKYQGKLVVEDSMYNRQIAEQLVLFKEEKIQTRQPDIYLPFQEIDKHLSDANSEKIMVWLAKLPEQLEAAKVQLQTPNLLHTQLAIEELKNAYNFVAYDLAKHMEKSNQVKDYKEVLDNTKLAIKDYLAFLNSKIINGEYVKLVSQ